MKKRFLVTAGLAAVTLTAAFAAPAINEICIQNTLTAAAAANDKTNWKFTVYDDHVVLTGINSWGELEGDVVIPGTMNANGVELPVTEIASSFRNSLPKRITALTIPESVTAIGDRAFFNGNSLTAITILGTVPVIEDATFYGCWSLESFTVPEGTVSIGADAFTGCTKMETLSLPSTLTSIGMSAFSGCIALTSVTIPGSVEVIDYNTFSQCAGLTSVTIENGVKSVESAAFEGCSSLSEMTFPPSVRRISTPHDFRSVFSGTYYATAPVHTVTIENPGCEINQLSGLTIRGYEGSTAQTHCANTSNTEFELIRPRPEAVFGDLTGDGSPDVTDAQMLLNYYVESLGGHSPSWYEVTLNPYAPLTADSSFGDLNGDGISDVTDSQMLLNYYAEVMCGNTPSWYEITGNPDAPDAP